MRALHRTLGLVLALGALSADAAPARTTVVVSGPAPLANVLESSLGAWAKVIRRPPLPLEANLEVARSAGASAVVTVRTGDGNAVIEVFEALEGTAVGRLEVPLARKGRLTALSRGRLAQLKQAITSGQSGSAQARTEPVAEADEKQQLVDPPPAAAPTPAPQLAEVRASNAPSATDRNSDVLKVGVGVRTFQRSLTWKDDLFSRMPNYQLPLGPSIALDAEVYPLALFTRSVASRLGIQGTYEQAVGIASVDADKQSYATSAVRIRANLAFSVPFNRFVIGAHAGWSMQTFAFAAVSSAQVERINIPSVGYSALRAGANAAVRVLETLWFELGAAYQAVLASGEIGGAGYFGNATVGGADFTAVIKWRVVKFLEAGLGAEYQRYWFSLNPKPGDPWIAGGALDEYRSLRLSLSWVL